MTCTRVVRFIFMSGLILSAISPLFPQPIVKKITRPALECVLCIGDTIRSADKLPTGFVDQLSTTMEQKNKQLWAKYSPESQTTFNGRSANEEDQIVKDWLVQAGITDANPTECKLSADQTYFCFQSKRNIEAKHDGLTKLPPTYDLSDLDLQQFAKDLGKAIGKTVVTKGDYSKDKFRLERAGKDNLSLKYLGEDIQTTISSRSQHDVVIRWLRDRFSRDPLIHEYSSGSGTYYVRQVYWRSNKLSERAIQNHISAYTGKPFSGSVTVNESDNIKVVIRINYKDVTQLSPNNLTDTFRPIIVGNFLKCYSKLIKQEQTIPAQFTNKNSKPWMYQIKVQNEN